MLKADKARAGQPATQNFQSRTSADEDQDQFMQKLDIKRNATASLLTALIDPQVKEITEKYAPLYELKM